MFIAGRKCMITMYLLSWRNEDFLWGLAVMILLPLILLEIGFLILAGITLRASAAKTGKGWFASTQFFVLAAVLGCTLTAFLHQIFPLKEHIFVNWLMSIVVALILVGIISYGLYHLLEWIDSALCNHDRKIKAVR